MASAVARGPSLLRPAAKGRAVVCYGDSLTAGYASGGFVMAPYAPVLERALGGDVRVDHCGHPGMTAREMAAYANEPQVGGPRLSTRPRAEVSKQMLDARRGIKPS